MFNILRTTTIADNHTVVSMNELHHWFACPSLVNLASHKWVFWGLPTAWLSDYGESITYHQEWTVSLTYNDNGLCQQTLLMICNYI